MGKIVITSTDGGKKQVAYKSSNRGAVEGLSDMNYKHFQNAYNLHNKNTGFTYTDLREKTDDEMVDIILDGEAAKRILLERDWVTDKKLEEICQKQLELEAAIKEYSDKKNKFKA